MRGRVQHWNAAKGYGFIKPEDLQADLFVHMSQIPADIVALAVGTKMEFDIGTRQGDHRSQAMNVRLVK